jgi:hypothetical protein
MAVELNLGKEMTRQILRGERQGKAGSTKMAPGLLIKAKNVGMFVCVPN